MGDRILVFGAHSDDETIGLGGTIARLAEIGYEVIVITFCWSETGEWEDSGYARAEWRRSIAMMRRDEALKADEILGVRKRIGLGLAVQGVVNDRATYQRVVKIIREYRPIAIFTHFYEDKHRDHRAVSALAEEARWKAAENVLADLGKPWYTPALFFYEVTEPFTHPSHVVDITETFHKKLEAMQAFRSQLEVLPGILDYIEGLAKARGFLIGVKYAEAFLDSHLLPQKGIKLLEL